jgi:inorganic pyrophosphatase
LVSECADTVDLDDLIAADGDLLDAIVADDRLATVGEVWRCALIGVLRRPDGDDKLIVVPEDRSQTSDLSGVIDGFSERLTSWWDQNERSVGCQGVDAAAQLLLDCMQVGSLFEETERG